MDDSVDRASTHVSLDSGPHDTIFSPISAPRVLDNEVGVRRRLRDCVIGDGVFAASRLCGFEVPAFVKLLPLAVRLSLVQIARATLCGHDFINLIHTFYSRLIANQGDLVIQRCCPAIGLGYDTSAVESELILICVHHDSNRAILKLGDSLLCFAHISSVVEDLSVVACDESARTCDLRISTVEVESVF